MQLTLRGVTDTAHPQPVIPIYRIHSIKEPFCARPGCWCQQSRVHVTPLLAAIRTGELALNVAASFAEDSAE
jgi:hypothetical protein